MPDDDVRARRLRPPRWRDRRLVVGVVLVLASVALGAAVIGRADTTSPMYAARHTLTPGQRLTTGDVRVVRVRLGRQASYYLDPSRLRAAGAVVVRSIQAGELVPASAVGPPETVTARPVAVPVPAAAVEGLRAGSLVDVWIARKDTGGQTFQVPEPVARSAEVVSVAKGGGVLGGSSGDTTIRLLLSGDLVARVLSAVDNGDRVNVVPVPGSVPGTGS
jgi:Chaperone for flagella basal body P-ring formation